MAKDKKGKAKSPATTTPQNKQESLPSDDGKAEAAPVSRDEFRRLMERLEGLEAQRSLPTADGARPAEDATRSLPTAADGAGETDQERSAARSLPFAADGAGPPVSRSLHTADGAQPAGGATRFPPSAADGAGLPESRSLHTADGAQLAGGATRFPCFAADGAGPSVSRSRRTAADARMIRDGTTRFLPSTADGAGPPAQPCARHLPTADGAGFASDSDYHRVDFPPRHRRARSRSADSSTDSSSAAPFAGRDPLDPATWGNVPDDLRPGIMTDLHARFAPLRADAGAAGHEAAAHLRTLHAIAAAVGPSGSAADRALVEIGRSTIGRCMVLDRLQAGDATGAAALSAELFGTQHTPHYLRSASKRADRASGWRRKRENPDQGGRPNTPREPSKRGGRKHRLSGDKPRRFR